MTNEIKIMNSKLETKVFLLKHTYMNDVTFEQEPPASMDLETRGKYSWVAHAKSTTWRSIYPMQTNTYVKYFKTLNGAKRNFIKTHINKEE